MARVGSRHKRAMRVLSRQPVSAGPVPEDCGCLTARLQMLRPGYKPPGAWISEDNACADYAARFSAVVSLPFWLLNDRARVHALIAEAIARGRRRWALECGNLFENLPLEIFTSVLEQVGRSVDNVSPRDAENLWLDPPEWLEPAT
jgi:hypothetical protein